MKRFLILAAVVAGLTLTGFSGAAMAAPRGYANGRGYDVPSWNGKRDVYYGGYRGGWNRYHYRNPRIITRVPAYPYGYGYGHGYGYGYGHNCGW